MIFPLFIKRKADFNHPPPRTNNAFFSFSKAQRKVVGPFALIRIQIRSAIDSVALLFELFSKEKLHPIFS